MVFHILYYIEDHGQNDEVEQNIKEKDKNQSEEFEKGKLLMLRIVWFSIFMFTHTVRIDIIMSSCLLQKSPQHLGVKS